MGKKTILTVLGIVFLTLSATIAAGSITERAVNTHLQNYFNNEADQIANTYYNKLHTQITILEGLRAFWNSTGGFTNQNFTSYLASLNLNTLDKSGASLYFFIPSLKKSNGTQDFSYPVTYIYPTLGMESVLGRDFATFPQRKDGIEYARDHNALATTMPLTLLTTGKPGFFFLLPLYKPGLSFERTPDRQKAFAGVVGASFRSESAFDQIFGGENPYPDLDFHIYQGDATTDDRLLFDSDPEFDHDDPRFHTTRIVRLYDQTWTIIIESKPSFSLIDNEQKLPTIVFTFGLLLTIALGAYSLIKISKIARTT